MGVRLMIPIKVDELKKQDIKKAMELWTRQYELYCSGKPSYPLYWRDNTGSIERLLEGMCEAGCAFAARTEEGLAGYLAFWEAPFHGENTAYCPVFAHGVQEENRESVYLALYNHVSRLWVSKDIFNHMLTLFYNDKELINLIFDLGFGSYVMDAFCLSSPSGGNCGVRRALQADADAVYELAEESRLYYKAAPIFLKRDVIEKEDIARLINEGFVFIAEADGEAAGFMNASVAKEGYAVTLETEGTALIDEIGAYIRPEHRGSGIGERLLMAIKDCCAREGIERIHVDFETANPYANRFWRKHFDPVLLSVRRGVNRDVNAVD